MTGPIDAEEFGRAIGELVRDSIAPLRERIEALEAKVGEGISYQGPHEVDKVYQPGNFVTHDGSLWHCNYKTATKPGDGAAWTLAVKRGRDAR